MRRLLRHADVLELSQGARTRLRWFAYALAHEGNVSLTCRHFGISRSTFLRWAHRFDPKRPETLEEHSRRPHTVRQPETDERIVTLIRLYREANGRCPKERIVQMLLAEHGITVSASTVGRIIRRYGFFFATTPSHLEKRGVDQVDTPSSTPDFVERPAPADRKPAAEGGIAPASAGAAVLVAAVTAAAFAPRTAHAANSDSYQLLDNFPNQAEADGDTSPSYQFRGGMTWVEKPPLTSGSYQIVTDPPQQVSSAASSAPSSVGGGGAGGDDGGGGGHRGHGSTSSLGISSVPTSSAAPQSESAASSVSSASRDHSEIPASARTSSRVRSERFRPAAPPEDQVALPPPGDIVAAPRRSCDLTCPVGHHCFFDAVEQACPASSSPSPCVLAPERGFGGFSPGILLTGGVSWFWPFLCTLAALVISLIAHALRERRLRTALAERRADRAKAKPRRRGATIATLLMTLAIGAASLHVTTANAATTAPLQHVYNGHLLSAAGTPVTTAVQIRFSYWTTSDYQVGDVTVGGAINTSAATYAGWSEVHTLTPNAQGYFSVRLGSGTALPTMSGFTLSDLLSLHLQVEVKPAAAADTSYELLDTNASDTIDRSPVLSVPFALNADMLDQRDVGTGSGSIPVLGSGGTIAPSQVPSGTIADRFTIDTNNTETSAVVLQFGATLAKTLSYDIANGYFNFNDDVNIQGDLTVTGLINGVDITTLQGSTDGKLRVFSGAGLTIGVNGGAYRLNGVSTTYNGGTGIAVGANTTSYVFFGSGGLTVRTMAFPTDESYIALATVTTNGTNVTAIADLRPFLTDDRERSEKSVLNPQYPGASYASDGSDNIGQLSVQKDDAIQRNYYKWVSTQSTLQDIDLTTRFTLSNDFVRWGSGLTLQYRTTTADSSQNAITSIAVYDTAGNLVTLVGSSTNLASASWASTTLTFGGTPTWQPGGEVVVVIRFASKDNNEAHIGALTLGTVHLDRE